MIEIITGSSNETLAILQNVTNPIISEELNREFTFSFTTVIDNDKSNYVTYQNKVSVENNYFNIIYTEEERTQDGLFINAQCEHVSYDLLSANFTAGFTATGQFSAVATTLLSGTGFTIGTVEITASETISVNESTNARYLLKQLASLYGGELKFEKYEVSLLTRRGADNGVQFRYRKNLIGVKRITDNRTKIAGLPTISYSVDVAELEFEQGYISKGVSSLESYKLGDTVKVIDEDLNLEVSLRIVKESHDTEQRMQGTVEISNFVDDLTDTITNIQTTTIVKDAIYNGNSIGPENGFLSTRSDELTQTYSNATDGFTMQLRDSTTASFTSVFYVQYDTATGTANLYLVGNAVFTGTVEASDIIGGTITIGTGSNTFNANGTDGIWLGATAFATAPFSSTLSGSATAYDLNLHGGLFNIGTGTNTLQFNTTDGLFLGNTAVASAPFRASMSGSVTATDITMTGNSTITGGTITGGIIQTATSGRRLVLTGSELQSLNNNNQIGFTLDGDDGFLKWYESATYTLTGFFGNDTTQVYEQLLISHDYILLAANNAIDLSTNTVTVGNVGSNIYMIGAVQFDDTVTGLTASTASNHDHGIPDGTVLQTTTGTITFQASGSHSHTIS